MVAARHCGMPEKSNYLHAQKLLHMQYKVKTAFGISKDYYTGTLEKPLFGTGQGSGASSAVWLTPVVVLMNTLDRLRANALDSSSLSSFSWCIITLPYSMLLSMIPLSSSMITTTRMAPDEMIKQTAEHRSNLGKTSRTQVELLNLKKCSWSHIYSEWKRVDRVLRPRSPGDPTILCQ
jgi:hypothetical protein